MSLRQINTNWTYISSYVNEANLVKALTKIADHYPEHDDRYIIVRTPEGRWTAIIKLDMSKGGYIGRYDGFMKM